MRDWAVLPHLLGRDWVGQAYMHVWQPPCPSYACSPICLLCLLCLHWPTCMYANPLAPPPICIAPPFAVACFRRKKSARGRLINLVLICISLSSCRVQAQASSAASAYMPSPQPNLIYLATISLKSQHWEEEREGAAKYTLQLPCF